MSDSAESILRRSLKAAAAIGLGVLSWKAYEGTWLDLGTTFGWPGTLVTIVAAAAAWHLVPTLFRGESDA